MNHRVMVLTYILQLLPKTNAIKVRKFVADNTGESVLENLNESALPTDSEIKAKNGETGIGTDGENLQDLIIIPGNRLYIMVTLLRMRVLGM